MIAEVYKEKGKEPWKYTRQVVASDGKIARRTTRYSTFNGAYLSAYSDWLNGKTDDLHLYYAWGTLRETLKR